MRIRERTDDDLDACERLARSVHELDGYPPRLPADLRGFIASPGAIGAWIAEQADGVVGHVVLNPSSSAEVMALASQATDRPPDQLAVVARLMVAPVARRQGVASSLVDRAAIAAVTHGLQPILDVACHFDAAIRLYEGSGWICAGTVSVHIGHGEAPLDELVYIGPTSRRS